MEKETNHLRIKKLNFKIQFLIAFSFIWSIFIIVISILLIVLTSYWELATGLLLTLPCSIGLGGIMPVIKFKKEINELKAM